MVLKNPVGLDTERPKQEFAFVKKTDFRKGIASKTIDWYLSASKRVVAHGSDSRTTTRYPHGLSFDE